MVGPATLASLQGLHKAGVVRDTTQVIDEETNRCVTLVQLLADQRQGPAQASSVAASQGQPVQAQASMPLPPPPPVADANKTSGRKPVSAERKAQQEREEFQRSLAETKEVFKQSATDLLKEEIVVPAPSEAIALLRKTFSDLLDAVAESKGLWLDLGSRAADEADRVGQGQMNAISERFAQRYRPDEMLHVSQRCYTAVYDRDGFSELYAEMYSRYQEIVFSPETSRLKRSESRFIEEQDIRDDIASHFDLADSFFMIFKLACLRATHAFKFRALLEGDFFRKNYSVDDVTYILGIPSTRACPDCRASVPGSAKACRSCNREFLDTDSVMVELNREVSSRLETCKRNAQRLADHLLKCGMSEDSAKGAEQVWLAIRGAAEKRQQPRREGPPPPLPVPNPSPRITAQPSPLAQAPAQQAKESRTSIDTPPVLPKVPLGASPPPIPLAPSGGSQTVTSDGADGGKGLFLERAVEDQPLIVRCKAALDAWSDSIPFSPIKKLGSTGVFVSARELAAYKTTVVSQIEKRWLEDHEVPYRGEPLPANYRPGSYFDPWERDFPRFADFASHHTSEDLVDTRQVYDCSRCHASGRITCSSCAGKGEVRCNSCDGYGHTKCWNCGGKGQLSKTRTAQRHVTCSVCRGSGEYSNPSTRCDRCAGRGAEIQNYDEEYYVPCGSCAASGKIPCSTCRSSGKVTCSTCSGSGEVTCPGCQGERRLMAYVSAEQAEEPVKGEHQFIPAGLPHFKKGKNPLSILTGASVFLQDEGFRVEAFGFKEEEAASVLTAEVETCRQKHEGHILRQQIDVERCSIIEYRYRHTGKTYTIYLNPQHDLVEDIAGPIQTAIEGMDALAQQAFDEKRYEDAFRLNLRALCMDEATDEEKGLRVQILNRLTSCYRNTALLIWLVASLPWLLVGASMSKPQFNFGVLLGLIPLLAGVHLFARDTALRFRRRSSRLVAAALIGVCGFLSGVAINSNSLELDKETHWADWFPLGVVIVAVIAVTIARAGERARRTEIEKSINTFPNAQALETYVCGLDPAGTTEADSVELSKEDYQKGHLG